MNHLKAKKHVSQILSDAADLAKQRKTTKEDLAGIVRMAIAAVDPQEVKPKAEPKKPKKPKKTKTEQDTTEYMGHKFKIVKGFDKNGQASSGGRIVERVSKQEWKALCQTMRTKGFKTKFLWEDQAKSKRIGFVFYKAS